MQNASKRRFNSTSLMEPATPFEQEKIDNIIFGVENDLRNLCYAMKVVSQKGFAQENYTDKDLPRSMLATFANVIDRSVDVLTTLTTAMEESGNPSIEELKRFLELEPQVTSKIAETERRLKVMEDDLLNRLKTAQRLIELLSVKGGGNA